MIDVAHENVARGKIAVNNLVACKKFHRLQTCARAQRKVFLFVADASNFHANDDAHRTNLIAIKNHLLCAKIRFVFGKKF